MSDLNTNRKVAGENPKFREIPLAADTYHIGMRLEYNVTNDDYEILSTGNLAAVYFGTEGRVLSGVGSDNAIVGGDIVESGLVDASGDPLGSALTQDELIAYQVQGFYVNQY